MVGLALKYRNGDKLHLSRGPGAVSWIIFVGFAVLGLVLAIYGTECIMWQCLCVVSSSILALLSIGEWEDIVVDRVKKIATLTRCNWYGRLCSKVITAHTKVLSLANISGIEVRGDTVVLVMRSAPPVVIAAHTDFRQLEAIHEEISSFLRLSRMERVHQEDVGVDWWMEWWDMLDGDNSDHSSTPSLQHSGVKVLVQQYDLVEPTAA